MLLKLWVPVLASLLIAALGHTDASVHYKYCPESWIQHGGRCYLKGDGFRTFADALESCDGQLPYILNEADNALLANISEETWLGLNFYKDLDRPVWSSHHQEILLSQTDYTNWIYEPETPAGFRYCAYLRWGERWRFTTDCGSYRPYVCEIGTGCDEGWHGVNCEYACHCLKDKCENQFLQRCPNGCQRGWRGKLCQISDHQSAVSVTYHCFKKQSGFSVLLSIDQQGTDYEVVAAVDVNGEPSPYCSKSGFLQGKTWNKLDLLINVTSYLMADCPAKLVNSTMEWTIRFQQFRQVRSAMDEDVQIVCDFSDVDALYSETGLTGMVTAETLSTTPKSANRSSISAEMYLATPDLTRVNTSDIYPGLQLVLVVAPVKANSTSVRVLLPRSCQAHSPDWELVMKLTDENGCSRSYIGFDKMEMKDTSHGPVHVSGSFPAFTFPGYDSVQFSCKLVPCLKSRPEDCTTCPP